MVSPIIKVHGRYVRRSDISGIEEGNASLGLSLVRVIYHALYWRIDHTLFTRDYSNSRSRTVGATGYDFCVQCTDYLRCVQSQINENTSLLCNYNLFQFLSTQHQWGWCIKRLFSGSTHLPSTSVLSKATSFNIVRKGL